MTGSGLNLTKAQLAAVRRSILFRDIPEQELPHALDFFDAQLKQYPGGTVINDPGSRLHRFGLVLTGQILVSFYDFEGNAVPMAEVRPGETFGESLCFLGRESGVYIRSLSDTEVLLLSPDRICSGEDPRLSACFTAMLADRTLRMNNRIQILSKRSIRGKIITYLSELQEDQSSHVEFQKAQSSHVVHVPLNRSDMADYLGTDRSALSRELSAMKRDGILDVHGRDFILNCGRQT